MRRLAVIGCLVLLAPTAARAFDPISSLDPGYPLALELQRRGALGDRLAPGVLAATDLSASGSELLARWQRVNRPPDGPAASLRPRVTMIGLHTSPERQLRPSYLDMRDGDAVDPLARARVAFVGRARLHPRVTAGVDFAFDTRGDNDPRNRTRTFSQLEASNNFDAAWMRLHFDRGAVTFGRLPFQWGPERLGGLLISDLGPAFDLVHGHLAWGPHTLQTFVGQLSSEVVDAESSRRWMYGHRADLFFLDDRLRFALSEIVLVAGPGEGLNLRYLNPIPMWAQIQVENDGDTGRQVNAIQSVDVTWQQGLGAWHLRSYGTLAVDDLQIDAEGRDRDPDQLAWSVGLDLSRDAWLLGYEYRRIGSWTYLHRGTGTDHRNFGRPLGAPEGPDTDRHDLRLDWRSRRTWNAYAGLARWRRGENRISTTENRLGRAGESFPRGTVEKRWVTTLGIEWQRPGTAKAALQAAFHSISGVDNVAGSDEDVFELRAVVDVFLPALSMRAD